MHFYILLLIAPIFYPYDMQIVLTYQYVMYIKKLFKMQSLRREVNLENVNPNVENLCIPNNWNKGVRMETTVELK